MSPSCQCPCVLLFVYLEGYIGLSFERSTFFACQLPCFLVPLDGHIVFHCLNRVVMFTGKWIPPGTSTYTMRVRDTFHYTIN